VGAYEAEGGNFGGLQGGTFAGLEGGSFGAPQGASVGAPQGGSAGGPEAGRSSGHEVGRSGGHEAGRSGGPEAGRSIGPEAKSFDEAEGESLGEAQGGNRASESAPPSCGPERNFDPSSGVQHSIHRFLQLPEVVVERRRRKTREEPLIDYSKSIILTSNDYLQSIEMKAERKEKARKEAELKKLEADKRKDARAAERRQKEAARIQREKDAQAREAFKQKWSADAIRQAGEHLQWLVKNSPCPPPGAYSAPFCGQLPEICKLNMAHRLAKRRVIKNGGSNIDNIPAATPHPWVHRCDPRYMVESVSGPAISRAPAATFTAPGHVPARQARSAGPVNTSRGILVTTQLRPAVAEGGGPVTPPHEQSNFAAGLLPGQALLRTETNPVQAQEAEAPPQRTP
jgi:hypothetical protein